MSKNMYPITNAGVFIVCVNNVNVDRECEKKSVKNNPSMIEYK